MEKQPFTPQGVEQKTAELYALSDSQLKTQADLVRANLRTWVKDNFILNAGQVAYLDSMDNDWIIYTGNECGFAMVHRLAIILVNLDPPSASKLIRTKPGYVMAGSPDGLVITGNLTIQIVYE